MTVRDSVDTMLEADGFCITGISGVSMLPMLRQGEDRVVLVRPTFPLAVGTVVLFRRGKERVLHRIVAIRNGVYVIRGDNCIGSDLVAENQIIGVLVGFWRGETYHDCTVGTECADYGIRANRSLPLRYAKAKLAGIKRRLKG